MKGDKNFITIEIDKKEIEDAAGKMAEEIAKDKIESAINIAIEDALIELKIEIQQNIQEELTNINKRIENIEQVLREFLAMKISEAKAKGENTKGLNHLKQRVL